MRLFYFNVWIPYFSMWYNSKKRRVTMSADWFMSFLEDWDSYDEETKRKMTKWLKYHFNKEK